MSVKREEHLKSLIEKMGAIVRGMYASNDFPFGECRVSGQQIRILFYLSRRKEGVSVKELAEYLNVTSGAVTQFIDLLVEKKLARREEDASDRRLLRIRLTEKAGTGFTDFKKHYFLKVSRAFDSLDDGEIHTLVALLDRVSVHPHSHRR
jgi:DNA-binding MarR family transcriptional regulator